MEDLEAGVCLMRRLLHLGTQDLETERLRLRRYTMDDVRPMYHNYCKDPDVTRFLVWSAHRSMHDTRMILSEWIKDYEQPRFYLWAIELKSLGEPIGTISAVAMNEQKKSVEIGYCIGKKWWGAGMMQEALSRVIDFFFIDVGMRRIEAFHDVNNPASGRVMEKCGMKFVRVVEHDPSYPEASGKANHYLLSQEDYVARQGRICPWALNSAEERQYHDHQWGIPIRDDDPLFEMLVLEYMQAGLSWRTILLKREAMRAAFDRFSPKKISNYNSKKIDELMENPKIIRNRRKLEALPVNASAFLQIQKEFGSFSKYIWGFVNNTPIVSGAETADDIPVKTELSEKMCYDMKKRGFVFIGPTIIYAYIQAIGIVNDHLHFCYLYNK